MAGDDNGGSGGCSGPPEWEGGARLSLKADVLIDRAEQFIVAIGEYLQGR